MATTITQTSNPALWATYEALVEQGNLAPGYITVGSDHIKIMEDPNGVHVFILYDNYTDLIDSRSSKGPKATYKKLDG